MRNESSEWNSMGEQDLIAEPLVEEHSMQASIESNHLVESNDIAKLTNQLDAISSTVSPMTTTAAPSTTVVSDPERDLERDLLAEMVPDSSIQAFLERLQRTRTDLRLQDIPNVLDEFFASFRQTFKIPRIRIRFQ